MKSFKEYSNQETLNESIIKNTSKAIIWKQIRDLDKKIKSETDLSKKINLISSQNHKMASLLMLTK